MTPPTSREDIFNLAVAVRETAQRHPERIAVVEPAGFDTEGRRSYRRFTYAQLSQDAEATAPGLREIGIRERTRIVCMTPPSYEACVIGLALQRVGATTLWIDPAVGYRNVGERLRRLRPEGFVGVPFAHAGRIAFGWGPRFPRRAIVINGRFPGAFTLAKLRRSAPLEPPAPAVAPDDPVAVLYTTGSTGPAKPTLYLHRNYTALFRVVHESWRFSEAGDVPVDMAVFPAFFFIAISAGGTMVVPPIDFRRETPAKADPQALLEVINDCSVRSCFGSPVLLENMARHAVAQGIRTPSFRRVIGGGAPITASVMQALLDMMGPEGEVYANYGATEALPSTEMGAVEVLGETWRRTLEGAGVCVGRPFPGVELRIVEMRDGIVERLDDVRSLPPGEVGEILVRSPHVSPAYLDDPESTRKNKIFDGDDVWHRIGDAGYMDEQGRLWYSGRLSQRVRTAEGALFSLHCEPIFDAHPDVRRSGLVAVPRGDVEIPVICVERHVGRGGDEARLRGELLAAAAAHPATQAIRHVLFIERLPTDPRHDSKIERPKLARWAASRV